MALVTRDRDDDGFQTLFDLYYWKPEGSPYHVGEVKIARFDMGRGGVYFRSVVQDEFERLGEEFFSVGQDESYYLRLTELGEELGTDVRDEVLRSLNDMALDPTLFARALSEPVTEQSLLRNVSPTTVRNQFHRLAIGGARLTDYSFTYHYPGGEPKLLFSVIKESKPPSNVHVVIGPNGVGKSRLLNQMAGLLLDPEDRPVDGYIHFMDVAGESVGQEASSEFANLISIAFSAFDDFEPFGGGRRGSSRGIGYTYVGLKKVDEQGGLKGGAELADEFGASMEVCLQGARKGRWRRALRALESDPIFADEQVARLAAEDAEDEALRSEAPDMFRQLSSGHKAVLLTITRLVECIEERSLVLLDEPETHLHPPLLSAFTRALSDLLINRNGVAIVATHSPVVLQEVPRDCVWVLRRAGNVVEADRPKIETFGENVGTLTSEVFGLEVTNSGFHKMLAEAVSGHRTYAEVLEAFDGKIGSEARALVQTLLAVRSRGY